MSPEDASQYRIYRAESILLVRKEMIPPLPKKRITTFKGDVLRLMTGAGLAQFITMLASPVTTRLYAPDAYGVAAMFTSILGIVSVLACMRYELSIVIATDDQEAANQLGLSISLALLVALFLTFILILTGPEILQVLNMPELAPYLLLIPVGILINGIFSAFSYWCTRSKEFTYLSLARFSGSIVITSATLAAGFSGYATAGAKIFSNLGGQFISLLMIGWLVVKVSEKDLFHGISYGGILSGLKKYKKFPLYNSWSILINAASWQFPVLLLGGFFSPSVVGFYALGFGILQMPLSLIVGAVGQVLLQQATVANQQANLSVLIRRLCHQLISFSLIPIAALAVIGNEFFLIVFGPDWGEAGIYSQLLAPWTFVWLMASPLSMIFIVLEKQQMEPVIQLVIFLSRLIAVVVGGFFDSPRLVIGLFSIAGLFSYGYLVKVVFSLSAVSVKDVIMDNMGAFHSALLCFMLILPVKYFLEPGLTLLLAIFICMVVYIAVNTSNIKALLKI